MTLFTGSLLVDLFVGLTVLGFLVYKFWTRKYDYWKKKGIAYMEPTFPLGTLWLNLLNQKEQIGHAHQKMYNQFKDERYFGIYAFREPELVLRDPKVIKYIMTKDFNHFVNRGIFPELKHDFISNHLFNMDGEPWKRMRSKLTPTFTSGKMKLMFNLIEVVAQQLTDYINPLAEKNSLVEIKEVIARFNTDIIATCAFGLEVDSLKQADSEFREIGRLIFKASKILSFKRRLIMFLPIITKVIPIYINDTRISNFILNILKDTIEYRKKNNIVRNDFIDLLTKVRNKTLTLDREEVMVKANGEVDHKDLHNGADGEELTLKEMAAQVFVFFAAGFETAASTTSFLLFEVSKNKDIQDKLRAEIDAVIKKYDGKVTYQALLEMHYMDKCIDETLRRYASLPLLRRQCVKTYKVPETNLVIEEGIKVVIPTYAIHHDPEHYLDPFKFDPERFSEEEVNSRHQYTFLPFGEGPRACIGKRLGIMQVKMAVITILKDFVVTPAPGLPDQLPVDPKITVTSSAVPIELLITKRNY